MNAFKSTPDHKTSYALKDNKLVHVSEVKRGLSCGCQCAACNRRLIARKGQNRIHHFAHEAQTNCANAAETVLHLLAKELIAKLANISLPQYKFDKEKKLKSGLSVKHEEIVVLGGSVNISSVSIEQAESRFIPDITLVSNSKKLFIEIAVTHHVDRAKLRHIRRSNIPTIEIKLNHSDATLTREALSTKLQSDLDSKKWLFHPKQRNAEQTYFDKLRTAIRNAKISSSNSHRKLTASPIIKGHDSNFSKAGGLSNAHEDRLLFDFYLAHKRQATSLEEAYSWRRSPRNRSTESQTPALSYAQIKGKRDE